MKRLRTVICKTSILIALVITFSGICQASQEIPESITIDQLHNLYEPVAFEHQMHADMFSCSRCHHHLQGAPEEENNCTNCHTQETTGVKVACQSCHLQISGTGEKNKENREPAFPFYHIDIPTFKGALHLQCAGCHREEGGPTGCRECHSFTEKGKKRFQVKE